MRLQSRRSDVSVPLAGEAPGRRRRPNRNLLQISPRRPRPPGRVPVWCAGASGVVRWRIISASSSPLVVSHSFMYESLTCEKLHLPSPSIASHRIRVPRRLFLYELPARSLPYI
jgi:hypothetical protein